VTYLPKVTVRASFREFAPLQLVKTVTNFSSTLNMNSEDKSKTLQTKPESPALPPFIEPSDDLCGEITKQTEFFFSNSNITKDTFLLKHVKRNKEGFVNLKLLISAYKPIKRLTQDWRQIAFAVKKCSTKLEVNEQETKIRRIDQIPSYDPTTPSKTVVATNFPMSSPTIKDVVNIFSSCGEIVQVRILRPGNPTSGDVKKYMAVHPEMEGKVCAFVEFESHELAQKAIRELNSSSNENLEVREYVESTDVKEDKNPKEVRKNKRKQKAEGKLHPKPNQQKPTKTAQNWGKMIKSQERESTLSIKFGKERGGTEVEGGEDDIGYSSDNEGIHNEWTNLVNRTIAMVFEEV